MHSGSVFLLVRLLARGNHSIVLECSTGEWKEQGLGLVGVGVAPDLSWSPSPGTCELRW